MVSHPVNCRQMRRMRSSLVSPYVHSGRRARMVILLPCPQKTCDWSILFKMTQRMTTKTRCHRTLTTPCQVDADSGHQGECEHSVDAKERGQPKPSGSSKVSARKPCAFYSSLLRARQAPRSSGTKLASAVDRQCRQMAQRYCLRNLSTYQLVIATQADMTRHDGRLPARDCRGVVWVHERTGSNVLELHSLLG